MGGVAATGRSKGGGPPAPRWRAAASTWLGPAAWLLLHAAVISHLLLWADCPLRRALHEGRPGPLLLPGALTALTAALFLRLHRSDPGFLPQEPPPAATPLPALHPPAATPSPPPPNPPPAPGHCHACRTPQPLRARHCTRCGRCVPRYDHHCTWLATCIGRRNAPAFLAYLWAQLALMLAAAHHTLLAFSLTALLDSADPSQLATAAVGLVLLFFVPFLGTLAVLHTYLACTNQTTHEVFGSHRRRRMLSAARGGPAGGAGAAAAGGVSFDRGWRANLQEFVCPATPHYEPVPPWQVGGGAGRLPLWCDNQYYSCF